MSPRAAALVGAGALFVLGVSWTVLHTGFWARDQIVDTPVYQRYGDAIEGGAVPYRDFSLEYPPGALPAFVVPSLLSHSGDDEGYRRVFEALMVACGGVALLCVLSTLRTLGVGPAAAAGSALLVAAAPLALGSVILTRFDLWPAALTAGALAALAAGRDRLGSSLLGVAFAAKLYPGVLAPLAVAHVWRRRGRREALVCAAILVASAAVVYLPFAILSPGGVWHSTTRQTDRPLQIESLGASFLIAVQQVVDIGIRRSDSHGSQNLTGGGASAVAVVVTLLQAAVLLAIWIGYARGPAERGRLVRYSAAAVCAFIAFGKVLSPQFLIWLIPLVPLVRGRRGLAASGALVLVLVLTQLYFPHRYWDLVNGFAPLPSWLLFARDVALVALVAILLLPGSLRPRRAAPRSP
jgi:hypothetical protein